MKLKFISRFRVMLEDGDLSVLVLASEVPDVVQRLEPVGRVDEVLLHDLVRDATNLRRN